MKKPILGLHGYDLGGLELQFKSAGTHTLLNPQPSHVAASDAVAAHQTPPPPSHTTAAGLPTPPPLPPPVSPLGTRCLRRSRVHSSATSDVVAAPPLDPPPSSSTESTVVPSHAAAPSLLTSLPPLHALHMLDPPLPPLRRIRCRRPSATAPLPIRGQEQKEKAAYTSCAMSKKD
ncbi:hypothetical protein GUJ93_ZPchr0003g16677 [Zizania palustris]|uniref:Uncharacterized protein n=1 Tax=Zizania palustris TaxID=103762 RepID=A0A8J5RYP6_ZIZPA|nr:hypothetical protein GUJ93_ZPchr0003g16677 [Zizania palustris]